MNESDIVEIFRRPLILGASVSADYAAPSPGRVLASRYTSPKSIVTIAAPGAKSHQILSRVTPDQLKDRTVVLGVDLFFWDSALHDCTASVQAMGTLALQTAKLKLPLLIGNIPGLLPSLQPGQPALNAALLRLANSHSQIKILDLDLIYRELRSRGYISHRGQRYRLRQLIPDGLHVNTIASEYLADKFLVLFGEKFKT